MTKLSEKLANASVKDAPGLLRELWMARQQREKPICSNTFMRLVTIGPEGWLSAVMMLVRDGLHVEIDTSQNSAKVFKLDERTPQYYEWDYFAQHEHPALALASAIAQTMENDDA